MSEAVAEVNQDPTVILEMVELAEMAAPDVNGGNSSFDSWVSFNDG
jgi:hypothetical protein